MQETEAILRLKRGDLDAMHVLVLSHSLKASCTAYLITHDRAAAEDVVQDAFIRAFRLIGSFDPSRPFGPWFLRIVVTLAIDAAGRTSQRRASRVDVAAALDRIPDLSKGPEEAVEWAEFRDEVWRVIEDLPPKQRAAIVLRYYLDLSEEEMARELGVARGTVKSRLHAARSRLRSLLRPLLFMEVR